MHLTPKNLSALLGLSLLASPALQAEAPINDKLPDPDGQPSDMSKPVQVFILLGQSNMLEFGKVKGGKDGTLDYASLTPIDADQADQIALCGRTWRPVQPDCRALQLR